MSEPRHWTLSEIIALCEDPDADESKIVLMLEAGHTAYSAVSTKYHWRGPGTVTYLVSPWGWEVIPDGVTRLYHD